MENNLPIVVFDITRPGNIKDVVFGKKIGTLVNERVIKIKDILISDCEKNMKQSMENTQHEFNTIRTGRASQHSLDRIFIDYYGAQRPN